MRKFILLLFIIAYQFIIVSTPLAADESSTPVPIIIDADIDTSDTNALLYLTNNPLVSVEAITVSCGVTYIDTGVENILRLIDYLDIENIPVAGGSSVPLEVNHTFPPEWRQGSTNFYGVSLADTQYQPVDVNASELIVNILNDADLPITILALGPLTNIANSLLLDPSIKEKILRIDIMGGAVDVPGNIGNVYPQIPNYVAEWNFYIDPHAVDIVFSTIENIRLIPLDATDQVPITSEFKSNLRKIKQTKEADIANQLLIEGLFFWDELTAVALTNPEVITLETSHIDVVIGQKNHEGQTIRNITAPVNVEVAIGADSVAFEKEFLSIINNGVIEEITDSTQSTSKNMDYGIYFILLIPLISLPFLKKRKPL
ncbi:MAG: nucleoside hydrolase [Candidatus Hodarchaeales archaeon]|jgi:pyrimidine-specific ribonucleoside hydrolase